MPIASLILSGALAAPAPAATPDADTYLGRWNVQITGGAIDPFEDRPGPLMLQGDHGKVRFRNIVVTPAR